MIKSQRLNEASINLGKVSSREEAEKVIISLLTTPNPDATLAASELQRKFNISKQDMIKLNREASKKESASVNEAVGITLIPTSSAKELEDKVLDDLTYDGMLLIFPKSSDIPVPWDPNISISGGKLIVTGGLGSGGVGKCTCEIPLNQASRFFNFEVNADDGSAFEDYATKRGWKVK